MVGIYKIENLITGKKYIGQSIHIEKRWNDEKRRAFQEATPEYTYPLSQAFRKYGLDSFTFEVIEECSVQELNARERYWIAYYNSFYDGYNQTLGGDSPISKPKPVIIGIINDLETTDMYHSEIAKKWDISQEMVQGINTGRYWFQETKSYPLQKKHKGKSRHIEQGVVQYREYFCAKCGAPITAKATLCVSCAKVASRKVERPEALALYNYLCSIQGNFSEASRYYGVSDNAIRKWCRAYGIPHKSSDYKKPKGEDNYDDQRNS